MRVASLSAAALLAAFFASGQALATDKCPRLESSSLVILIPEGGCDADATAILEETKGVTVIRGPGRAQMAAAISGSEAHAAAPEGRRTIVVVVDQRR